MLLSERTLPAAISERLRRFTEEMPFERRSILAFVSEVAERLPPGSRIVDVGAGSAPYRELFDHADYVTVDWAESQHEEARSSDIIASAQALPVSDESFDAVLMTQVLEHVPSPEGVLEEMHRVLRPGGSINLTAPLVWELHEQPHDYFRFTCYGLEALLAHAGFEAIEVRPRNDCFTTLAQLLSNAGWTMRRAEGLDERRRRIGESLEELAGYIAEFAPLEVPYELPLGYAATATRPDAGSAPP